MESDEGFYQSCQCAGICGLHAGMCTITDRDQFGRGASVSRHGMLCRRCTEGEFAPGPLGLRITVSTVNLSELQGDRQRFVEYATLPNGLTREATHEVAQQLLQRLSANVSTLTDAIFETYTEAAGAAEAVTGTLETETPVPPPREHALQYWRPSITASVMRFVEFLSPRPMLRGLLTGWLGLVCFVGVLTGLPVNLAALMGGTDALAPADLLLTRARMDVLLWVVDLVLVLPALGYILRHYWLQRMLMRRMKELDTNPMTWPAIARIVEASSKFNADAIDYNAEQRRVRARVQALLQQADPVERMYCELAWNMRSSR